MVSNLVLPQRVSGAVKRVIPSFSPEIKKNLQKK